MNISKLLLAGTITASSLMGHSLWLNSFDSLSKKGGHTTVGIGWGHNISIDDSVPSKMQFDSFDLIDPKGEKIALKKPFSKVERIFEGDNLTITQSNMAMQKISFDEKSQKGTYSVALATKTGYFTKYIDKKGKTRFKREPKDKIKNAEKILSSNQINTFAKSYFAFQEWTQPKKAGHNLEIIPTSDLTKVKAGDSVTFEILYEGKALQSGYVTAKSEQNPHANALFSPIKKGIAKFTLPNNGKWIFKTTHKKEAELTLINNASATITIK